MMGTAASLELDDDGSPRCTLFFLAPISLHAHWAHGHSNLGWPRAIWTASVRVGLGRGGHRGSRSAARGALTCGRGGDPRCLHPRACRVRLRGGRGLLRSCAREGLRQRQCTVRKRRRGTSAGCCRWRRGCAAGMTRGAQVAHQRDHVFLERLRDAKLHDLLGELLYGATSIG